MLEDADDVAVGRVSVVAEELSLLDGFVEFCQIHLVDAHFDCFLDEIGQIG